MLFGLLCTYEWRRGKGGVRLLLYDWIWALWFASFSLISLLQGLVVVWCIGPEVLKPSFYLYPELDLLWERGRERSSSGQTCSYSLPGDEPAWEVRAGTLLITRARDPRASLLYRGMVTIDVTTPTQPLLDQGLHPLEPAQFRLRFLRPTTVHPVTERYTSSTWTCKSSPYRTPTPSWTHPIPEKTKKCMERFRSTDIYWFLAANFTVCFNKLLNTFYYSFDIWSGNADNELRWAHLQFVYICRTAP